MAKRNLSPVCLSCGCPRTPETTNWRDFAKGRLFGHCRKCRYERQKAQYLKRASERNQPGYQDKPGRRTKPHCKCGILKTSENTASSNYTYSGLSALCRECTSNYNGSEKVRTKFLARYYNITLAEYKAQFIRQGGVCYG